MRAVEHCPAGMVYESDTVQASFGIDTVNHLYIHIFQLVGKRFFRTYSCMALTISCRALLVRLFLFTFSAVAANFFCRAS